MFATAYYKNKLFLQQLGPVAPTSLNFKSYLSPDLRTTYGRLYRS